MDEYQEIGARLRALREARGKSQSDVAGALGVGQVGYGAYERGERKLPLMDVPKIADALGMRRLTLLRLLGLAELDDTEPVPQWMLDLFNAPRQNNARPFGQKLRRSRLSPPTPAADDPLQWRFAAHATPHFSDRGRTPVLVPS